MSVLYAEKNIFDVWHSVLVTTGKLNAIDASIYVLALNKGTIKSSDVSSEFQEIRQNTAINRLKVLAQKGFLEVSPKETKSKRPHAIEFRVVHPKIALRDFIEKSMQLSDLLKRYEEHWEHLSENPTETNEVWLSKSSRAAVGIGASMLSGAKQEIRIYCHDCSWFDYLDIQIALESVLANGVSVSVIADSTRNTIIEKLSEMGVSVYICNDFSGPPFCIIDENWLLLPTQTGTLSKKYSALRTNDKYLITHFTSLFDVAQNHSKPWEVN